MKANKKKQKRGNADTNIYTTHTDILSIITVLKICLSLRAIETTVYILEYNSKKIHKTRESMATWH